MRCVGIERKAEEGFANSVAVVGARRDDRIAVRRNYEFHLHNHFHDDIDADVDSKVVNRRSAVRRAPGVGAYLTSGTYHACELVGDYGLVRNAEHDIEGH